MMFQDQEEQKSRANTGSYVHVQCEKGPRDRSATSLRCTQVMKTRLCLLYVYMYTCTPATLRR